MNYENDIKIEEDALDLEWLEQASLMMKYSKNLAQLDADRDRAKEKLDLVRAELDKAIRSNPDKYDIDKITETAVTSTILMQKRFKDATEEYIEAKFEYNVAAGAVKAFDGRKSALENLVKLHGQQYFAGPKMPRDLSNERKKRQEDTKEHNAGVASKMQRKR